MMTSRDRVMRALSHEAVDRVPRDLWVAPATAAFRPDEVAELLYRYPADIERPEFAYPRGECERGKPDRSGEYTDAWGCTWQIQDVGSRRRLIASPLTSAALMAKYRPPMEILEKANLAAVDQSCAASSQFVVAPSQTCPFDRLCWLRGESAARSDVKRASKSALALLAALDAFACREMELWARSAVDAVEIADHWAGDEGLLVPVDAWRELFKPMYAQYCRILHESDKYVFFRTSGNIGGVLPDLAEIGVDAVQTDLTAADTARLAEQFRGRITLWMGLCPAKMLAAGLPEEVRQSVRRIRQVLDESKGGLIARCEWEPQIRFRNVAAFFEQWLEPLSTPTVPPG